MGDIGPQAESCATNREVKPSGPGLLLLAAREPYLASDPRVPGKRSGSRIVLSGVPERTLVGAIKGHAAVVAPATGRVRL